MRACTLLVLLAACGGGNSGTDPDAGADAGDGDLCGPGDGCLTRIADVEDWDQVSIAVDTRCDLDQATKFLAPATATAALQTTVYQDVGTHPYHLDFMRSVLAEHFGGITLPQYAELVQRRATRQYWAGEIFRVVDADGVVGYGFDLIVDPSSTDERPTEAEVQAVGDLLAATFELPLGYAPILPGAINDALGYQTSFAIHLPSVCPGQTCDAPGADCLTVPAALASCGVFFEGRPVDQEHAAKTIVYLAPGAWELPQTGGPTALTLFSGGVYGQDQTPLVAGAPGEVVVQSGPGWVAHTYRQTLTAGERELALEFQLYGDPAQTQTFTIDDVYLAESFYAYGTFDESPDPADVVHLASCGYPTLDRFTAAGMLADGDWFSLDIRHRLPFAGSGPLQIVGAEVSLGGTAVTVSDYFQLVYAGEHHNWNNNYWVIFDAPIAYAGHDVYGLWVDEAAYTCCPVDGVYTMDAAFAKLDTLTVLDYSFAME